MNGVEGDLIYRTRASEVDARLLYRRLVLILKSHLLVFFWLR